MRSGPGSWALGAGASVVLHGAGAVVALALVVPEDMPEQPTPGAQFELETTALERSRAEETPPESAEAEERAAEGAVAQGQSIARRTAPASTPTGTAAAAVEEASPAAAALNPPAEQAVAQSPDLEITQSAAPDAPRAEAQAPEGNVAAAIVSESTPAVAEEPESARAETAVATGAEARPTEVTATAVATATVSGAPAPTAQALGVMAPAAPPVGTAAPSAEAVSLVAAAAPAQGRAAPSAEADAQTAAATPATGAPAPTASAQGTPAASAEAPATQAAAAAIEGPVIGAELAWAGQGSLDPQGLAAVQAFLPAADRSDEGEEVRDDISSLMSSVPCARVHTAFNPDTGALELRGHVPTAEARPELVGALQTRVGETLPVTDALRLLPEPQCDVLSGIEGLGLPPSEEQFTDPALVGETGWAQDYSFRGGDALELQLRGADYPAYVYLDYYDGDGNVVHVVPNEFIALPFLQPDEPFFVGPDDGFEIYFSPPYGQDIVVAIATEEPLYEGLRPLVEPAEAYLTYLRARMEALGEARGEWAYFFVTTRAP